MQRSHFFPIRLALSALTATSCIQCTDAAGPGWIETFARQVALATPSVAVAFMIVMYVFALFSSLYSRFPHRLGFRTGGVYLSEVANDISRVFNGVKRTLRAFLGLMVMRLASYRLFRGNKETVGIITVLYAATLSAFLLNLYSRGRNGRVASDAITYNFCLFWVIESDLLKPFSPVGAVVGAEVLAPFLESVRRALFLPFDFQRFLLREPLPSFDQVVAGNVDPDRVTVEPDIRYVSWYLRQLQYRAKGLFRRGMGNFGRMPRLTSETFALGLSIYLHQMAAQIAVKKGFFK